MSADLVSENAKLQKSNSALLKITEITRQLVSAHDLDYILTGITNAAIEIVKAESATTFLYDAQANQLYFKVALGEKGEEVKSFRLPVDDKSIAGYIAQQRECLNIADATQDPRHYKKIDQTVGYATKSVLGAPILYQAELLGVIEAINKTEGTFDQEDENLLLTLASQAAIALKNAQLIKDLRNFFIHGIELLITALESLTPASKGQTFRVARIATALARKLGLEGKAFENIYYAALLHNIGMLKLSTESEPMDLRLHPILGADLFKEIKILEGIVPIIRSHHERFDGSGYPEGLKGEAIPRAAQIVGLADLVEEVNNSFADPEKFKLFLAENQNKFSPEILNALREIYLP